ncbi:MAG: PilZ domain-containing protein [Candidatus Omnitrophica bacterium]|nr:PilZ domain-containing protein [Candidatus Omnitrophota bacterium]
MAKYVPQIIKRQVGEVEILDLKGDFVGPWAMRGREEIERFITASHPKNLLINLKDVDTIDSLGVKAIVDNLQGGVKSGIVSANYSVAEMFSRLPVSSGVQLFRDEEDVVHFFAEELARPSAHSLAEEKRKYARLKTAYPLIFMFKDNEGQERMFNSVVTNLSEGGLYAEYLDLEPASGNIRKIDPYDFKLIHMAIRLPEEKEIHIEGKVLRTDIEAEQMGIAVEFYYMTEENLRKVRRLLAQEGAE